MRQLLTGLSLLLAATLAHAAPSPHPQEDRLMQVFLDQREVGKHRFSFEPNGRTLEVRSEADFRVRVAFVTLFSYEHQADELWHEGCLQRLESATDENGTDHAVSGRVQNARLQLDTLTGRQSIEHECPWSFAYWTPELRERELLVNPQDGQSFQVSFQKLGEETLRIGRHDRRATAWELKGKAVNDNGADASDEPIRFVLFYDEQDRWLGLDSPLDNGRTLHYRPSEGDPLFSPD